MMFDDSADIQAFYNANPEYEDERLSRHQLEFDMTWRYLDQFLPESGHILEVGAATGKYTVGLAKRGYQVTAVDISTGLLEMCRDTLAQEKLLDTVDLVEADARDLSQIKKGDFDAVLLMGPLYHLFSEGERQQALRESMNHLRPGGILFSAHISRFGIMGNIIRMDPALIDDEQTLEAVVEYGYIPKEKAHSGFHGYFATVPELVPLHESIGLETIILAGIEPGISDDDESYNKLKGKQRERWLDLFYEMSKMPSVIGASRHLLYVGQKPKYK
ncbi:MAG: class I SAM-dependent methyltransferase [Chloroflexota bacterium]